MISNNLKSFSDENIINVITRIQSGSVAYNLSDLKAVLSEVTSRKMGQEYIDLLAGLIKNKLSENAAAETEVKNYRKMLDDAEVEDGISMDDMPPMPKESEEKPSFKEIMRGKVAAAKEKKDKFDTAAYDKPLATDFAAPAEENYYVDDDLDYDAFPTLSFLASLYKTLGWVLFVITILAGLGFSVSTYLNNILYMAGIIIVSIIIGTIFLVGFYAASEGIWLKLEIERHLRRLDKKG